MTRLKGHQFSIGGGLIQGDTEFDPDPSTPIAGGDGGDQAGWAPIIGSHGVYDATEDLKFGMSVFSVSGAALNPDAGWTGRHDVDKIELLTLTLNPTVAYRVNEKFSVAVGMNATYVEINYRLTAPLGGQGQVTIDGDDWAFGFNLGGLYEVSPQTRIGVIYVSEFEPEFDGDVELKFRGGAIITAPSTLKFTYPQVLRVGLYHELDDKWAVLGSIGWEEWSALDSLFVATATGAGEIPTGFDDTYHFSGGLHYRMNKDWLLQTGITYDTSPVSSSDRLAALPVDRQIRLAVGSQYQWNERITIGGALEYIDLGESRINNPNVLVGEYDTNRIFVLAFNMGYQF
jgi:long-chain fatty acid transport protein